MKKLRRILLSQNSLAKTLGVIKFFKATQHDHHLQIKETLKFTNVLVLAPHPDDDVFGCGGTLVKLAKERARLKIVYFCDGAGGKPEERIKNAECRIKNDEENLVEIRKEEARKAVEGLGQIEQIFFDHPDGKLEATPSEVRALQDLILKEKPDIIFVPSLLDNHPDHRSVNEILRQAIVGKNTASEIWMYEVWTPLFPNRLVDISQEIELKKRMIATHKSQLESRGYDKAIIALNQYRAEINNFPGFAEAFFATTPEIYLKLANS